MKMLLVAGIYSCNKRISKPVQPGIGGILWFSLSHCILIMLLLVSQDYFKKAF